MQLYAKNEKDMAQLGAFLATALKKGDVIALIGDLGTGKTTLSKAIGKALGIAEHMASPSYTIVNAYNSDLGPLYHADVYRIEAVSALDDIGFFDYIHDNGVVIVEWADKIESALAYETSKLIRIELRVVGEGRGLTISGYSDFYKRFSEVSHEIISD
jgi:tRNA threonylcarbamoyladenosine biosynthesis protein TsaE